MTSQIKKVYECCIRPVITYGIAVTYPRTAAGRRRIERVNKLAARMITRRYDCSYEDLLIRLQWDSIRWVMVKDLLMIMYRYVRIDRKNEVSSTWVRLIERETGRRTGRNSNSHQYRTIGPSHRLSRTSESSVHRMVFLWNSLPDDIVTLDLRTVFMEKICGSVQKASLTTVITETG
jgi:hypothetical protein